MKKFLYLIISVVFVACNGGENGNTEYIPCEDRSPLELSFIWDESMGGNNYLDPPLYFRMYLNEEKCGYGFKVSPAERANSLALTQETNRITVDYDVTARVLPVNSDQLVYFLIMSSNQVLFRKLMEPVDTVGLRVTYQLKGQQIINHKFAENSGLSCFLWSNVQDTYDGSYAYFIVEGNFSN